MAWTGTSAPLYHLLIFVESLNETFCKFMESLNETFCKFMHMIAILLYHRYTVCWNIFAHFERIQDFHILLEHDKSLIIRLTHNINLFLVPDMSSINSFSRSHVTYWQTFKYTKLSSDLGICHQLHINSYHYCRYCCYLLVSLNALTLHSFKSILQGQCERHMAHVNKRMSA